MPVPKSLVCLLLSVASGLVIAGCNVFDEHLIPEEDAQAEPGDELAVADQLSCEAPPNLSVNDYRRVDLGAFGNDLPSLPNCLGELAAPGNDTFFAVDMDAGSKWHFHVRLLSQTIDPVIYVLDSCSDSRSCQDTYFGINACPPGGDEHFSFVAPATGRYYVALDSMTEGGEPVDVFAVRADCGDLVKQHSEFCDDGNDDPLDGCHQCRPVLLVDRGEMEPNDGPLDANLIRLGEDGFGARRIDGTLGSRCDFDFFEIEIPPGAFTSVTLGDQVDCGLAEIELRAPGEPHPFELSPIAAGAGCPGIENAELEPGTYLVRVTSRQPGSADSPALAYELDVAVSKASAD